MEMTTAQRTVTVSDGSKFDVLIDEVSEYGRHTFYVDVQTTRGDFKGAWSYYDADRTMTIEDAFASVVVEIDAE